MANAIHLPQLTQKTIWPINANFDGSSGSDLGAY